MRRVVLAAALAAALPAVAGAQPPLFVASKKGAALYNANCLSCHGSRGEGVSPRDPTRGSLALKGAGPSLRGVGALAADFYLRTGYMPLESPKEQPKRHRVLFDEQQLTALVDHVASFGRGPAVPQPHPERGDLSQGQRLFTEHCAGCHQVVAEGGYVTNARVPPLEDATPVQVAEAVRLGPYLMPRFSRKAIGDRELDSIVRYVEYAKHPADDGGWAIGHVGPVPEGLVSWLIGAAALVAVCAGLGRRRVR